MASLPPLAPPPADLHLEARASKLERTLSHRITLDARNPCFSSCRESDPGWNFLPGRSLHTITSICAQTAHIFLNSSEKDRKRRHQTIPHNFPPCFQRKEREACPLRQLNYPTPGETHSLLIFKILGRFLTSFFQEREKADRASPELVFF